jgi:hypothetical protein
MDNSHPEGFLKLDECLNLETTAETAGKTRQTYDVAGKMKCDYFRRALMACCSYLAKRR